MTAYLVLIREEIFDQEKYEEEYRKLVPPTFAGTGMMPIARSRGSHTRVLEGEAIEGISVVAFPTAEDAEAWYNSPGYQEAVNARQSLGKCRIIVVEGV